MNNPPRMISLRHLLLALGALAALGLNSALRAADSPPPAAVVTFYDAATVKGPEIALADVALVESDAAGLRRRLAAVPVGRSPAAGFTTSVSARFSKLRVRVAGIPMSDVEFSGATLIRVTRAAQTIKGERLFQAAAEAVGKLVEHGIPLQVSLPRDVVAPLGEVKLLVPGLRAPQPNRTTTVRVTVTVNGEPVARRTVTLRIVIPAPMLVAVRDLPAGTVLADEDLRIETRPTPVGDLALSQLSQAIGQQTTRAVKAGSPLTRRLVKPAVLVRRNERCQLICTGHGFTVKATGKALADGTLGQKVRVRNLSSKAELQGIVIGPGRVRIEF